MLFLQSTYFQGALLFLFTAKVINSGAQSGSWLIYARKVTTFYLDATAYLPNINVLGYTIKTS